MGLERVKEFLPFCIPCGDCWAHAPANPFRDDAIPPPYLKCPIFERFHFLSYTLRGIWGIADAVYNRRFPITPDVLKRVYACLSCGLCAEDCWLRENAMPMLRAFRTEIMEAGLLPLDVQQVLGSIRDRGHPWRGTRFLRTDWIGELSVKSLVEDNGNNVDILYWVGCTAALEDRSTGIAQAMAKLLRSAGIKFGILGSEESCCGEPAFWLGDEYLFQAQAQKNIEVLKRYNVRRIVTSCPHCLHVLKNEYPKFGSDFKVLHHTQYLAELIRTGKIKVQGELADKVTYHDPCFLGRYNGIYDQPREILNSIHGVTLIEMTQERKWAFCCGGGSGHMWLRDDALSERPNMVRTAQAMETEAGILATSCPYCLQQFEDAIRTRGLTESIRVVDVVELLTSACHNLSDIP
jgi:Fe-S oxidoreductase